MQIPPSRARIVARGLVAAGQNMDLESLAQSVQICRIWNSERSRQKCLYGLKDKSNDETCSKREGGGGVSQKDE